MAKKTLTREQIKRLLELLSRLPEDEVLGLWIKALGRLAERNPKLAVAWIEIGYKKKALKEVADVMSEWMRENVNPGRVAVWTHRAYMDILLEIARILEPNDQGVA